MIEFISMVSLSIILLSFSVISICGAVYVCIGLFNYVRDL